MRWLAVAAVGLAAAGCSTAATAAPGPATSTSTSTTAGSPVVARAEAAAAVAPVDPPADGDVDGVTVTMDALLQPVVRVGLVNHTTRPQGYVVQVGLVDQYGPAGNVELVVPWLGPGQATSVEQPSLSSAGGGQLAQVKGYVTNVVRRPAG